MDRNRFHRLVTKQRRTIPWSTRIIWGLAALLILQFFVPLALNSYEYRFKPEEVCEDCTALIPPVARKVFCFGPPPNRTCPSCGVEWNAGSHRIVSMPWIIQAVGILFRWG